MDMKTATHTDRFKIEFIPGNASFQPTEWIGLSEHVTQFPIPPVTRSYLTAGCASDSSRGTGDVEFFDDETSLAWRLMNSGKALFDIVVSFLTKGGTVYRTLKIIECQVTTVEMSSLDHSKCAPVLVRATYSYKALVWSYPKAD